MLFGLIAVVAEPPANDESASGLFSLNWLEDAENTPETTKRENDNDDDDDRFEGEDFLFRLEEAYAQRRGELQVSFAFDFASGREREREFSFEDGKRDVETETSRANTYGYLVEIEYGVTDRLQIEVEIPYFSVRERSSEGLFESGNLADIEVGLGYALVEETETLPAVLASFEIALPTGDHRKEIGNDRFGYGGRLAMSKDFGRWVGHLNVGYEYVNDARLWFANGEDGPKLDLNGIEYGAGVVYKFDDSWHGIVELVGETGEELELDGRRWETELSLIPGLRYGIETRGFGDFEFGVAFPVGLTSDSEDWGVIAKVQWEMEP